MNLKIDTTLNSILYSNRAIIHLNLNNYALALSDSKSALKWDKNYIKAYYRKANANFYLKNYNEALLDYKYILSKHPDDSYALDKVKEIYKLIDDRQKIIENKQTNEYKLYIQTKNLNYSFILNYINSIEIDEDYTGPHLSEKITIDWIKTNIIEKMKNNIYIHKKYLLQLIYSFIELNINLPSLINIEVPKDAKITICGDIHGQFYDLLSIFETNGYPSENNLYVFTGDFVDRGSFGLEVITTLILFKLLYPNYFYMSRGNHENKSINILYGFANEMKQKYDLDVYEAFSIMFYTLPLAHVINNKIIALHGGLFSKDGVTLNEIKNINRFIEIPESGIMCELLWIDPMRTNGRIPSKRGVAILYGPDIVDDFLKTNNLSLLVRSHEMKMMGYEKIGNVITVFSAPNYCDQMGNMGAYLVINGNDLKYDIKQFKAVSHPPAPNYCISWMF